jgi:N6-L-threonylcarbamoyladenine synthase/protein kinase Bud32
MIALLGAKMYAAGDTLAVEDSSVDANFRPDEVPVTWRDDAEDVAIAPESGTEIRGAEAVVDVEDVVTKRRVPKPYRHPDLDARLRETRTRSEARLTHAARGVGVPTPVVRDIDDAEGTLVFEHVGDRDLARALSPDRVRAVGAHLAALHDAGFVHGDPTTRNVRVTGDAQRPDPDADLTTATGAADAGLTTATGAADADAGTATESDDERVFLIDFGLGYHSEHVEDYAMDLHVFDQSLVGTARDPEPLRAALRDGYATAAGDDRVLDRLEAVEGRGRYQ